MFRPLQSNEAELEDLMYNLCSQISFGRLSLNSISSLASIGLIDLFLIRSKFLDVSDQTRQVAQLFTADEISFQFFNVQRHNHTQIISYIVVSKVI